MDQHSGPEQRRMAPPRRGVGYPGRQPRGREYDGRGLHVAAGAHRRDPVFSRDTRLAAPGQPGSSKGEGMRADINRVHGNRRHTGGQRGVTTMWLRTVGCIVTFALGMLVASHTIEAQPRAQLPLVGFLRHGRQADAPLQRRLDEFRQGLRDLGYLEGQNILLEVRYSEGLLDRLPELAAEFVRLQVDVLVVHGPQGVRAAREATSTIPIVMARMDDADEHGFVASLARPGGNITGMSAQTGELSP